MAVAVTKQGKALSWSNSLIETSAGVKSQAGQGGSTVHAAATLFCPFQKDCLITRSTLQCQLSIRGNWSVRSF
jgi:hypothetical protein